MVPDLSLAVPQLCPCAPLPHPMLCLPVKSPRDAVAAPSLEVSKAGFDEAWRNLGQWEAELNVL